MPAPLPPAPQVQESKNFERIAAAAKASAKNENVRKSNAAKLAQIIEEKEETIRQEKPEQPVLHFKEKPPVLA